jgi:competence protein ComEA
VTKYQVKNKLIYTAGKYCDIIIVKCRGCMVCNPKTKLTEVRLNNKAGYLAVLGAFIIVTIIGFILLPRDEIVIKPKSEEESYIYVHIEGCVNEPGLIKAKEGTRLYELIELAGGKKEDADLSKVNLASIVTDEQKIIIPAILVYEENSSTTTNGHININTASEKELEEITGVGPSTAKKIIQYRESKGYFTDIEDMLNVEGIGQSKFEQMKDEITI